MKKLHTLGRIALVALLATAGGTALSASYTLAQTGFTGGGTLAGSFSGIDADNNDLLVLTELSAFELHFAGDTLVPDLDLMLGDLDGFGFRIGTAALGDETHEGISTASLRFLSGIAAAGSAVTFVDDGVASVSESGSPMAVQPRNDGGGGGGGGGGGPRPLPQPSSWALLSLAGLALICAAAPRRRLTR